MSVKTRTKSNKANLPTLGHWAAGLAFASELIHLWMLPDEFVVSPMRGLFFALVGACQGMLAVSLLFGPGKWAVRFGILLNAGIVIVWAITRFVAVPVFLPLLGFTRLPVGSLDLTATAAELVLVILLVRLGRDRHVRWGASLKIDRKERLRG